MSEAVAETDTEEEINDAKDAKGSAITRKFRAESDASIYEYLKSLNTETPIKVSVIRELPKTWEGRGIDGTLDNFEEPISEEEIREMFGGGKYKLVIYAPNSKGSWEYVTARKIKIAGDPKLDGLVTTGSSKQAPGQSEDVVRDAMRMSQQMAFRAEERAARIEQSRYESREDPTTRLAMDEMRAMRRELSSKDEKIYDMINSRSSSSSASDMLLGKMIDGESARMQGLRQQMESELRMKNEMHRSEIDRLHQRYEDISRRQEDQHKREIDNLIRSNDNQMTVLKASYDGQMAGYQREIAHLDRQLAAAQKEIAELRSKKDKSAIDSITELVTMKEALDSFSGKNDDEGGSAIERIIGNVMGSPLLEGIATRVAGGPQAMGADIPQHQEAEEEIDIPVNRPVQLPDGRIIVRKPDGSILQLRRKAQAPAPSGGAGVQISDEELRLAAQFMESALQADSDPAEFGRTARNLAPSLTSGPIQELLKSQGVDAFLERIAKINPHSRLLSQHGKNWTRKVAAVLLES